LLVAERDLVTTGAPIARNIDGYLAHQGHQTGDVAAAASGRGITLSDGEGQEERAPTRSPERTVRDKWRTDLPAYRIGKHLRWKERDVFAWIDRQTA
jgi:hypothetical protein